MTALNCPRDRAAAMTALNRPGPRGSDDGSQSRAAPLAAGLERGGRSLSGRRPRGASAGGAGLAPGRRCRVRGLPLDLPSVGFQKLLRLWPAAGLHGRGAHRATIWTRLDLSAIQRSAGSWLFANATWRSTGPPAGRPALCPPPVHNCPWLQNVRAAVPADGAGWLHPALRLARKHLGAARRHRRCCSGWPARGWSCHV